MGRGNGNFHIMEPFWTGIDPEFLDFLCPKPVILGLGVYFCPVENRFCFILPDLNFPS